MRRWILILTTTICLGAMSLAVGATPAQADDYWDGHWGWYDGTYRPYVAQRYYSPSPYSGRYYGPSYGSPSYGYPGDGYYYGRRYYGDYYGTPNMGYRDFPSGGGQVRMGPVRFGWR